MTPEEWDVHWLRIRDGSITDGCLPTEAEAFADAETPVQFGPRPQEETP